jgi:hypothetical protein
MSKLIFGLFAIILITGAGIIRKPLPGERTMASQQAWGKARSDVSVRIIEREHTKGQVALTGEIRTELSEVKVEWKLPEGVTVAEGSTSDTIHRDADTELIRSHITVNVPENLAQPHIVFFAYREENGQRTGQSRVFNLMKNSFASEHIQKIKQMMLERGGTHRE